MSGEDVPATEREHASLVVGEEAAMRPVTQYVKAYYWTCQDCGWFGTGLFSMNAAMAEAGRHYDDAHAVEGLTAPLIVERRDQEKPTNG